MTVPMANVNDAVAKTMKLLCDSTADR
jgi:hypothetical protein